MNLPRVLVIDDEPLIRTAVARALGEHANVQCAGSAEDALRECEREIDDGVFDVVVLDIWLPGLPDGIDFYRRLEKLGARMPRVVFMSGDWNAAGVVRERLQVACIQKPFDRETLLDAIEQSATVTPRSPRISTLRRR